MKQTNILVLLFIIVGGSFFFASCSREQKQKEAGQGMPEHGMQASWQFTLPQGDPVQGRKVFVQLECYKCHKVKGETFPAVAASGRGVGPELSQMAGMHPVEFFAESVMNPNAVMNADAKEKGYLGNVCDVLGIEADYFRLGLIRWKEKRLAAQVYKLKRKHRMQGV